MRLLGRDWYAKIQIVGMCFPHVIWAVLGVVPILDILLSETQDYVLIMHFRDEGRK
jgi:hypothetical protein